MFDSTPWLGSGFLELLALCFLAVLAVATLVVWVVDRVHRRAQRVAQRAVVHLIRAGQRIDLDLIYVGEEDGQHVFEAVGVPPLPTDRFCVDTLPPKTTVRYCLDPKLIPVPKELPDA